MGKRKEQPQDVEAGSPRPGQAQGPAPTEYLRFFVGATPRGCPGQGNPAPTTIDSGVDQGHAIADPGVGQGCALTILTPRSRPKILKGKTMKLGTSCGNLYMTINSVGQAPSPVEPFEVFCHLGKPGGCTMAQLAALARIISLCLRLGGSVKDICKQLRGIKCPQGITSDAIRVESCADAIAKAFEVIQEKSALPIRVGEVIIDEQKEAQSKKD